MFSNSWNILYFFGIWRKVHTQIHVLFFWFMTLKTWDCITFLLTIHIITLKLGEYRSPFHSVKYILQLDLEISRFVYFKILSLLCCFDFYFKGKYYPVGNVSTHLFPKHQFHFPLFSVYFCINNEWHQESNNNLSSFLMFHLFFSVGEIFVTYAHLCLLSIKGRTSIAFIKFVVMTMDFAKAI